NVLDLLRRAREEPGPWGDGAAKPDEPGQRLLLGNPRRVEPVMARRRAEVPHPRLAVAGEERPPRELVARPLADDGRRHVANVVLVEQEQRAESGSRERLPHATQAIAVQPPEVHALFEVDLHVAGRLERTVPAVPGIGGGRRRTRRRGRLLRHEDLRERGRSRYSIK